MFCSGVENRVIHRHSGAFAQENWGIYPSKKFWFRQNRSYVRPVSASSVSRGEISRFKYPLYFVVF